MQLPYYPGSKYKLLDVLLPRLLPLTEGAAMFVEPFVGSGAVTLAMMNRFPDLEYWLNDRDPTVACLWHAVRFHALELIKTIAAFHPSEESFYTYKAQLNAIEGVPATRQGRIEIGFKKLALHRMSHSGFGGGIRGGRNQKLITKIDARWDADQLIRTVQVIHNRFQLVRGVQITGFDYATVITGTTKPALIYCDPPYWANRSNFYRYRLSLDEHERLAEILKQTSHSWLLSHTNNQDIRRLYRWAQVESLDDYEWQLAITPPRQGWGDQRTPV